MTGTPDKELEKTWKSSLHEVLFEADTPAGKAFDVILLWCIALSILAVMLESVSSIERDHGSALRIAEWIFTILFTVEYGLRILSVRRPLKYILSFFGVIDLLALLPTYLSLIIAGSQGLMVIRAVRLLRVFRVLKFARYSSAAKTLVVALRASRPKITVFFSGVLTLVTIIGSLMYLIEGQENGFTSIPRSIYWAIVTLTTVGYGDITPATTLGQAFSACVMILGYSIIAVPTGIVAVELSKASGEKIITQACRDCGSGGHDYDAKYCKYCGGSL